MRDWIVRPASQPNVDVFCEMPGRVPNSSTATETLAAFHLLAKQLQALADVQGDATQQGFLVQRGPTVTAHHLAPRRPNEVIGVMPVAPLPQGEFCGQFGGDVSVFGVPYDMGSGSSGAENAFQLSQAAASDPQQIIIIQMELVRFDL